MVTCVVVGRSNISLVPFVRLTCSYVDISVTQTGTSRSLWLRSGESSNKHYALRITHYTTGTIYCLTCVLEEKSPYVQLSSTPPHPHTKSQQVKQKDQHANSHTTADSICSLQAEVTHPATTDAQEDP